MTAGKHARTAHPMGSDQGTTELLDVDFVGRASSDRPTRGRSGRWRLLTAVGVLLVVGGLASIGFVGWQLVGTNLVARHHQGVVKDQIAARWSDEGPSGDAVDESWRTGDGVALVRIPRFGDDYEMPLLAGTSDHDLARGIGWFTDSARPGQLGNFAIAAHRVTHGEPFSRFLELREGDEVIVETRTHVYTYRLSENGNARVVDFGETWVLDPVPGKPDAPPAESLITLVTCAEIFHTDDRNVVFGALQSVERK